jgi:hypothetical protein
LIGNFRQRVSSKSRVVLASVISERHKLHNVPLCHTTSTAQQTVVAVENFHLAKIGIADSDTSDVIAILGSAT